jgi:hypothetical protein
VVEVVVGGIVAVEVAVGVDVGVALAVPSNVAVGEVSPAVGVSVYSAVDVGSPVAVSFGVGVGFPHMDGLEESCGLTLMLRPVSTEISSKMAESTGKNEKNGQEL